MNIENYGFNGLYKALANEYPEYEPARILVQEKGMYIIATNRGEKHAVVSGKFMHEAAEVADYPAVGDFVMVSNSGDGGNAIIHKVLNRKSIFTRRAAGTSRQEQVVCANVDRVLICMSLNNDFNIRRLERYLSIAWESGAKPVIVLTKSDLCDDLDSAKNQAASVAFGVDIVVTSSVIEDGMSDIMPYIRTGETAAFIGSSGVGKSTIMNYLIGDSVIATNGLRNDDKGRHTTTHRELRLLDNGAMVIDTPGMREIGMWGSEDGIDEAFQDVEEFSSLCRYADCTHTSEPGCAVIEAIEEGALSIERLNAYRKLCAENAYALNSESFLQEKEKKFKEISRINKRNRK